MFIVTSTCILFGVWHLSNGPHPAAKSEKAFLKHTNQHDNPTSTNTRAVELPTSPRTGPTVPRASPGPPPPRGDMPKNLTNGAEGSGIGRRSVAPGPFAAPDCG